MTKALSPALEQGVSRELQQQLITVDTDQLSLAEFVIKCQQIDTRLARASQRNISAPGLSRPRFSAYGTPTATRPATPAASAAANLAATQARAPAATPRADPDAMDIDRARSRPPVLALLSLARRDSAVGRIVFA